MKTIYFTISIKQAKQKGVAIIDGLACYNNCSIEIIRQMKGYFVVEPYWANAFELDLEFLGITDYLRTSEI